MVKVKKDSREWDVNVEMSHDECQYAFYPINIYACLHPSFGHAVVSGLEFVECTLENCPAKIRGSYEPY